MKYFLKIQKKHVLFLLLYYGLICMSFHSAIGQITVKGTIISTSDGLPLPGVNVMEKGTLTGAVTDLDGNFILSVSSQDTTLVFSFIGYVTQEVNVAGQSHIEVTMKEDVQSLDEVVVIGYGTVKKSDLTGSVAVVSSEDLARIPAVNVGSALQGRAAGVTVLQSGAAGGDYNIRIRGIGSINSNPNPIFVVDGMIVDNINNIAPQDIESMQVLKDASATAIYGANGANGVIIISTKRGEKGKIKVNFSAYYGFNTIPSQLNIMNADEYASFYNEIAALNENESQFAYSDDFRAFYYGDDWHEGTNWQDEIIQKSSTQSYHMGLSGGLENSNYNVSVNYTKDKGLLYDNNADLFSIRANSDFKLGKYIKVGESLNVTHREIEGEGSGAFGSALDVSPLMKVYNKDNKEGFEGPSILVDYPVSADSILRVLNTGFNDKGNPLGDRVIPDNIKYRNLASLSVYLEIQPFDWLILKSEPSVIGKFERDYSWTPTYEMGVRTKNAAILEEIYREGYSYSFQNQLTLVKSFGLHNFNLIGVHHGRKGYTNIGQLGGIGYNYENLNVIDQASEKTAQGQYNPWGELSYLGRLIYDYKSKYYLTANIRRDGVSRFGDKQKWGTFPAASLVWKVNEDFLQDIAWLNMLKLRFGWGKTGNSKIGDFKYAQYLDEPNSFHAVVGNERVPALNEWYNLGNPYIQWESAEMTNLGVDIYLFHQRLQFSAEYFDKRTADLLTQVETS